MKQLDKLSKDELIKMHPSRLDKNHMKGQSTDKYSIRNGILEAEFGRKKLAEYDDHMSKKEKTPAPHPLQAKIDDTGRKQKIPTGKQKSMKQVPTTPIRYQQGTQGT